MVIFGNWVIVTMHKEFERFHELYRSKQHVQVKQAHFKVACKHYDLP